MRTIFAIGRPPPIVPKLAEEDREGSPGVPGEGVARIVISVTRKLKNSLEIQHYFHCVYLRRRLELQTNQ
jgi:hypothetical protein